MKKILIILTFAFISLFNLLTLNFNVSYAESNKNSITTKCKSSYIIDAESGQCIFKENETLRLPIASVCKVMTLNVCFDAINNGNLSLDDVVTVSANAAGMGGSQVFLKENCQYKLSELIKSIIVCSANDSSVAVAETVCGSEESFVELMNKKAEELGCLNTQFSNCTGLPKANQFSCAEDVAKMFAYLIKNPAYFTFSKIWLEDFKHPDDRTICITNTNKLIKKYSYCDGGKTGFTNEAGFCLVSTAKNNNVRLISVVLGAESSDDRFKSAINMFNYGFANYKNKIILDKTVSLNDNFTLLNGKKRDFEVKPERDSKVFCGIKENPEITFNVIDYKVKAPVSVGQEVGKIEVFKNGVLYDEVKVVSCENVLKADFGDYFKNVSENWVL
ncbi:MAG: D-alanyl-D-alanine carboxypeptidase [Clostridia bacterium]|nr:D-alanyl-D-alanine carboxypeptidase [Clostridia bacterium]